MNPYATGQRLSVLGNIVVALTFYERCSETTIWDDMPQVPQPGNTVFASLSGDPGDRKAWGVTHVSWAKETPTSAWHAEIGLA